MTDKVWAEHTPGPWAVDERNGCEVFEVEGGGLIAIAGDWYPRGENHPAENMRLIAAAPELLERLEECAAHLESLENSMPGERVLYAGDLNAIGMRALHARLAIAKARGRRQ